MKSVRLLLIRHGETDWNRQLRFQGQIDVPLNELGLAQADRLARHLSQSEWDQALELHCSDLLRARQTAAPMANERRVLQAQEGLREQGFGVFEGQSVAELQQQQPDLWASGAVSTLILNCLAVKAPNVSMDV